MSQNDTILNHLRTSGSITPLEAINRYGITRLGARVYDLKQRGYIITRTMEFTRNRNGDPTRYARYYLEEQS